MKGIRLAVSESGVAAGAASPALRRLSRYPTRTAPAVPGHVRSRHRRPPAASDPASAAETINLTAPGYPGRVDLPEQPCPR
jgi:hypothetical protein